ITNVEGELVAFAKYGVDALTDQLVSREAATLAELGEHCDDNRLVRTKVPRLVAAGKHGGHNYVVQTPVPTTPRARDPHAVAASQTEIALLPRGSASAAAVAAIGKQWLTRAESTNNSATTAFA